MRRKGDLGNSKPLFKIAIRRAFELLVVAAESIHGSRKLAKAVILIDTSLPGVCASFEDHEIVKLREVRQEWARVRDMTGRKAEIQPCFLLTSST